MRLILATLIFAVASPWADAADSKAQCNNRCESNYQMCLNRARTKQARKSCKVDRKTCRGGCR